MIETGGMARDARKPNSENPTMLRFNVADVPAVADALRARGVDVAVTEFSWGVVGTFHDPDGNACELKDAGDHTFRSEVGKRPRCCRSEPGTHAISSLFQLPRGLRLCPQSS